MPRPTLTLVVHPVVPWSDPGGDKGLHLAVAGARHAHPSGVVAVTGSADRRPYGYRWPTCRPVTQIPSDPRWPEPWPRGARGGSPWWGLGETPTTLVAHGDAVVPGMVQVAPGTGRWLPVANVRDWQHFPRQGQWAPGVVATLVALVDVLDDLPDWWVRRIPEPGPMVWAPGYVGS